MNMGQSLDLSKKKSASGVCGSLHEGKLCTVLILERILMKNDLMGVNVHNFVFFFE